MPKQPQQTFRQAIVTRYLPGTATKPSRIKAHCRAGQLIVSYDDSYDNGENHRLAASKLIAQLGWDDARYFGEWVGGVLPNQDYAWTLREKK